MLSYLFFVYLKYTGTPAFAFVPKHERNMLPSFFPK